MLIVLFVVIALLIALCIMKYMTKIDTKNQLSEVTIGKDRSLVRNLMYPEEDLLVENDDYDIYKKQLFFGIECDLYFHYDSNGKVKQITYIKFLDNGENINDYKRNIDSIIDYYSDEYNNTKDSELEFTKFDEDFYQYTWVSISGDKYYDLEISDSQISMSVI